MATRPFVQPKPRLDTIFRSESLLAIREFFARSPELWPLVEDRILQIYAIVDANRVYAELLWRLGKRENPQARSGLEEALDAGVLVLIAPNFLKGEIEKYLPQIAEETEKTLSEVESEWHLFQPKVHFYEPSSRVPDGVVVDAKDLAYKHASDELSLPVLTQDRDIARMGAPVLWLSIDLACRDHARASSVTLGFTIGSGFSVTIGIEALCAAAKGIKGLFEGFRRLPAWAQAAIIGTTIAIAVHPKSRAKILQVCNSAWTLAREAKEPLLKGLIPLMNELAVAHSDADRTKAEIRAALPPAKKVSALVYAKRICVVCGGPASLEEITRRMRAAGYVSRAKNFQGYLRRVLRRSDQFVEVSPGIWGLSRCSIWPS